MNGDVNSFFRAGGYQFSTQSILSPDGAWSTLGGGVSTASSSEEFGYHGSQSYSGAYLISPTETSVVNSSFSEHGTSSSSSQTTTNWVRDDDGWREASWRTDDSGSATAAYSYGCNETLTSESSWGDAANGGRETSQILTSESISYGSGYGYSRSILTTIESDGTEVVSGSGSGGGWSAASATQRREVQFSGESWSTNGDIYTHNTNQNATTDVADDGYSYQENWFDGYGGSGGGSGSGSGSFSGSNSASSQVSRLDSSNWTRIETFIGSASGGSCSGDGSGSGSGSGTSSESGSGSSEVHYPYSQNNDYPGPYGNYTGTNPGGSFNPWASGVGYTTPSKMSCHTPAGTAYSGTSMSSTGGGSASAEPSVLGRAWRWSNNLAGGIVDDLTFGQHKRFRTWLGNGVDSIDTNSPAYKLGENGSTTVQMMTPAGWGKTLVKEAAEQVLKEGAERLLKESAEKAAKVADKAADAAKKVDAPTRVTNPKHHPNSASPEPTNAQALFDKSIVDSKGVRWVKDSDGTIHRFTAPSNGQSHWNGSSAGPKPILEQNIPPEIRRALE